MQVTVAIPVYGNRETIFRLLGSLENQSYKKFDTCIVFRHSDNVEEDKHTLDRIEGYDLSINIMKQHRGGIPEAMNTIFGIDSHVIINTDDDAYASKNWIKDHVGFHDKHKNVGMATGLVREVGLRTGGIQGSIDRVLNAQKWRISNFAAIDPPIDDRFADYGMYIGKSGMLVDTGKKHNMIKTFKQHGVNMSWKGNAMQDLKLPPYAPRGHRYEAYIAMLMERKGYSVVWFDKGINFHRTHESSSRGKSITTVPPETIMTDVLFSYYVSRLYTVDLSILRTRTQISGIIAKTISSNKNNWYEEGYVIAKRAITRGWSPSKVRRELVGAIKRSNR
ncbi:MAG: glycosyltransferase family 2 protein [Candidatus Marsarchaeota archaeon]|jgi:glycosyltransferase involved in cell wall biosynthesis|nr:glycosyltransferase family 2 protein [Candidatus Marsarchaeota archaeon]MCL5111257.1 glycosyltransferase family 2 protein [Candidatus Marsarchaeota archaeon]